MPFSARTAALVTLITATSVVYGSVAAKLAVDWWTEPDYSHGLLCAPLAIVLVFRRRAQLAALPREPRIAGLVGAALAMGTLALGILGAELFLTRVSLLLFIASSTVFLWGWRHLRALVFPLALLLLSIPIPAIVITRITLPLQFAASMMTESALNVLNVPVLREGNVLALPNATLQVAEACSGIRSLVSLAVLALMVARFAERRTVARAAIVLAAVPTAVLVNGLRVTVTAVTTYRFGPAAAEGLVHEAVGCLTFLVALALLVGCARAVRSVGPQPAAAGAFQ